MVMASAGLHQAIDRRNRAAYAVVRSAFAASENSRSLSVPAALRLQGSISSSGFDDLALGPSGSSSVGGGVATAATMSRGRSTAASTIPIRAARSASPHETPTATREQIRQLLKTKQESGTSVTQSPDGGGSSKADRHRDTPSIPLSRNGSHAAAEDTGKDQAATTPNAKQLQREPKHETCSRSSGQRVKARQSVRAHSGSTEEKFVSAREGKMSSEAGALPAEFDQPSTKDLGEGGQQSEFCVPKKFLELMDDRDKAVELCLQVHERYRQVRTE